MGRGPVKARAVARFGGYWAGGTCAASCVCALYWISPAAEELLAACHAGAARGSHALAASVPIALLRPGWCFRPPLRLGILAAGAAALGLAWSLSIFEATDGGSRGDAAEGLGLALALAAALSSHGPGARLATAVYASVLLAGWLLLWLLRGDQVVHLWLYWGEHFWTLAPLGGLSCAIGAGRSRQRCVVAGRGWGAGAPRGVGGVALVLWPLGGALVGAAAAEAPDVLAFTALCGGPVGGGGARTAWLVTPLLDAATAGGAGIGAAALHLWGLQIFYWLLWEFGAHPSAAVAPLLGPVLALLAAGGVAFSARVQRQPRG